MSNQKGNSIYLKSWFSKSIDWLENFYITIIEESLFGYILILILNIFFKIFSECSIIPKSF